MTERRARGDGGLHWDENRARWIATVTIGYDAKGKRITRKRSGRTKTEAKPSCASCSGTRTMVRRLRLTPIPSATR